uniref:Neprosin_AP domain-containing protein n=1 Tax=Heterorhabditis bacteriophora TaxID=37862 RepID=A0A1I7XNM8_HETBA
MSKHSKFRSHFEITNPELGFCARWKRRGKVRPGNMDVADARQAVGSSFVEHHLPIDQLKDVYPDSFIHPELPERSDGLHTEEAK